MIDSEFERKGREMATTWDNLLETNDALMRRIAELERERDAATKRAEQAEASAVRWEKRANQAAGRALEFRDAWKDADTDARRLAKIAKNVHFVSESENNLIEKYAK